MLAGLYFKCVPPFVPTVCASEFTICKYKVKAKTVRHGSKKCCVSDTTCHCFANWAGYSAPFGKHIRVNSGVFMVHI